VLTDSGQRLKRERDEKDVGTVVPIRSHLKPFVANLKPFDTFRCHLKPDPYTDQQWQVFLDQDKEMNENEKRDWGFSVNNEGKTDPQITIPQKSLSLKEDPGASP
jgi:hypothetical protein